MTLYDDAIMRTIVDLPEQDIQTLDGLCAREHISRAEAVRRAVSGYLKTHRAGDDNVAFGMWKERKQDGLRYQYDIRDEWSVLTVHEQP